MRKNLMNLAAVLALSVHGSLGARAGESDSSLAGAPAWPSYDSPAALVATEDGKLLFIACATPNQVAVFDTASGRIAHRIDVPASPLGLALSKDGARLYVTCAAASSTLCVIKAATGEILEQIPVGHTAMAPVLSPDEQTLYVCNRFDDDVSFIGLGTGKELRRVKVQREPIAAAVTPDGHYLLVANHLHAGCADGDVAAAVISVIDTASARVVQEIALPNGSGLLRDVRISPDGQHACVTHILAKFHYVPRTVHFGWINQNAISGGRAVPVVMMPTRGPTGSTGTSSTMAPTTRKTSRACCSPI